MKTAKAHNGPPQTSTTGQQLVTTEFATDLDTMVSTIENDTIDERVSRLVERISASADALKVNQFFATISATGTIGETSRVYLTKVGEMSLLDFCTAIVRAAGQEDEAEPEVPVQVEASKAAKSKKEPKAPKAPKAEKEPKAPKAGKAPKAEVKEEEEEEEAPAKAPKTPPKAKKTSAEEDLTEARESIVGLLEKDSNGLPASKIVESLGLHRNVVQAILDALIADGKAVREGQARGTKYKLI